jgi:hypothetical protein
VVWKNTKLENWKNLVVPSALAGVGRLWNGFWIPALAPSFWGRPQGRFCTVIPQVFDLKRVGGANGNRRAYPRVPARSSRANSCRFSAGCFNDAAQKALWNADVVPPWCPRLLTVRSRIWGK